MKAPIALELDITNLSHDGRGVAHHEGKAIFVRGALIGERVVAHIVQRHRHYDDAQVDTLLSRSPDRVDPLCEHFGICGGCALQHLAPAAQIAAKQRVLAENFDRIGHVEPKRWLAPLTSAVWGYRRKGRLSVKYVEKKGKALVGFREENGRYVADIKRCEVLAPAVGLRIEALAQLVGSLQAVREIPQIEIAAGDDTTALIFRHLQPLSEGDRAALVAFAQAHGLAVYLQPGGNDSVHPLWPDNPRLAFRIASADVELEFRPMDFIQVNSAMNEAMIGHALGLLDPQPDERVLDLFCGLGNFTFPLARRSAHVVGVEGEHGLVQRAKENAARNGIANVEYHVANLLDDQRDTPWARQRFDKILLDPPRSGAAAVFDYLPKKGTDRLVYVSCHPATLARDAGILVDKHGFKLKAAGVMDMFPHTAHVESIALFER
ncbi:23S rRNA m(5)U-1939 methyltransferase [Tahibacter aquaticus]|uniref:23S rRNA (uracil(1939)-C(5))-methyltransferase RlmD n=1 Tax=Tahibacter aquaticus TaxID=520092 RepID=A0A4R6YP41_9GAMM|nr:23S rRNA (uracil(1939)-C(5))-methyltransferase RlmD [Tahibacter aquaticus]TDR39396.1 23S rRNA m(5)U-1939 methyltransferase [Tahibacter aquaticus]